MTSILERTASGTSIVPTNARLTADRILTIEGEITQESAREFCKQLLILNMDDRVTPVKVIINSPGGEINAGMLIYDAIQGSAAPVVLYCWGMAYSMAAILFACGTQGCYILPNSEFMLHEPLIGSRIGGSTSAIRSLSESLIETKARIVRLLSLHTGRTEADMEEAISHDRFYTAEECVQEGFCDGIVDFKQIMEVNV